MDEQLESLSKTRTEKTYTPNQKTGDCKTDEKFEGDLMNSKNWKCFLQYFVIEIIFIGCYQKSHKYDLVDVSSQVPHNSSAINIIGKNQKSKKYFCIYCKKLLCKLAAHLEKQHSGEADVIKFSRLPKGELFLKDFISIFKLKQTGNCTCHTFSSFRNLKSD